MHVLAHYKNYCFVIKVLDMGFVAHLSQFQDTDIARIHKTKRFYISFKVKSCGDPSTFLLYHGSLDHFCNV